MDTWQILMVVLSLVVAWSFPKLMSALARCFLPTKSKQAFINAHFFKGLEILQKHKKKRVEILTALAEFDAALFLDPTDFRLRAFRAIALDLLGDDARCLEELNIIVNSITESQNSKSTSSKFFDKILSLLSKNELSKQETLGADAELKAQALIKRSYILLRNKQIDAAYEDAKSAVPLLPHSLQASYLLGCCYQARGLEREALIAFKEAGIEQPHAEPDKAIFQKLSPKNAWAIRR